MKKLRNYCRMRKHQFICARLFINRLADIEKQRLESEKSFVEILRLWNNHENDMPAPLPNLDQ